MTSPANIAAVVIGRNEGERLEASLRSVQAAGLPVVYVDSGSSDGSLAAARKLGVELVELDPTRPSTGRATGSFLSPGARELTETIAEDVGG